MDGDEPIVVPTDPTLHPSRRTRLAFRLAALVLIAWGVAATVIAVSAWRELRRGIDSLEAGRASLDLGDLATERPADLLERSGDRFARAVSLVENPILKPVRVLPIAGRQLRSVDALATTARDLSRAGEASARDVVAAIGDVPAEGPGRVEAVERVDAAMASAERALTGVDLGPDEALVGSLARRRNQVAVEVAETQAGLRDARALLATVRSLVAGPRRYLLVAANNAEMRAGVGMFLSIGVLETEGGRMRLGDMQPAGDLVLDGDGVPVEGDLAARWGFTQLGKEWRNLAPSPHFPASAAVAARMWQAKTGQAVDGVLAVDVLAVAALLDATGPVSAGDVEVDSDGAEDYLLHDQYEQFGPASEDQDERRELLGELAGAVVDELAAGDADPGELAKSLRSSVRERHLLAWAADPEEQRGWEAAGVGGALRPESLGLALLNRGGNKLDPFQEVEATVETSTGGGSTEVRVHVQVTNRTPGDEPPYVAGPGRGLTVAPGTYTGFLALTVPGAASGAAVEGGPLIAHGSDGPAGVVATQFEAPRGGTFETTFSFRLPGRSGTFHLEPSARPQGTLWHIGDEAWRDDKPRALKW